jgi:UDP-N-acetylglucosamine 2-epimerase (non-hydrolysing)
MAGTPETHEVILVAGARPNFVKVAPVMRALASHHGLIRPWLLHTGQHSDPLMSSVFFEQLGIPAPEVHLGAPTGSHGAQTAYIMAAFERTLLARRAPPAGVVVVGDVNSTLACALVAVKLGIPVAHVEAGLRSFDRSMPEEINRIVTDAVADLHFVSEPAGETNLRNEGVADRRIHYVGNVMIDTLVSELPMVKTLSRGPDTPSDAYVLVTLHRPSNVDDAERLTALVTLLDRISRQFAIVFPVHPRTRARLQKLGLAERLQSRPNILLRDPLGYREFMRLLLDGAAILTDSGGIQEEASFLDIPCLTLRANTERPATVTLGTNTLVGDRLTEVPRLLEAVRQKTYKKSSPIPGWDGQAAPRIARVLVKEWSQNPSGA